MYFWCEEQRSENSISNPGFNIIKFVQLVKWLPGEHFYSMCSDINLHQNTKKNSTIITFCNYNQFCKLDTFYWIVTPSNSQSTVVVVILWFTNVSKYRPEEGRRLKGDVSLEHVLDQRLRIRIVRMFGFVVGFTQNVAGFARFDVGSWISKLEWENPALYK